MANILFMCIYSLIYLKKEKNFVKKHKKIIIKKRKIKKNFRKNFGEKNLN
jgi:hypothetical protein